ncbi:hypothetical protein [Enterococcus sp. ZJ1622]|uniref:hypothetical protein n=1 Tax=Enterococcus sp. ZJ1622 TaxID=2709401 RepID=UPI0013EDE230|nr:hypothetical protein [Enterococcus sp. ZJ1622]
MSKIVQKVLQVFLFQTSFISTVSIFSGLTLSQLSIVSNTQGFLKKWLGVMPGTMPLAVIKKMSLCPYYWISVFFLGMGLFLWFARREQKKHK